MTLTKIRFRLRHGFVRLLHGAYGRISHALLYHKQGINAHPFRRRRSVPVKNHYDRGALPRPRHPSRRLIEIDVPRAAIASQYISCSAAALQATKAQPSDSDIDDAIKANICRCVTYSGFVKAVDLRREVARRSCEDLASRARINRVQSAGRETVEVGGRPMSAGTTKLGGLQAGPPATRCVDLRSFLKSSNRGWRGGRPGIGFYIFLDAMKRLRQSARRHGGATALNAWMRIAPTIPYTSTSQSELGRWQIHDGALHDCRQEV